MQLDWQNIVVAAIVAGAAWYVVAGFVRMWRGRKGGTCGSCSSCPSAEAAAPKSSVPANLVSVDSLLRPKR